MNGTRTQTFLLLVVVVVIVGVVLHALQSVFLPVVLATLLTFLLSPVVQLFERTRIPTAIGTLIIIILLLGVGFLVGLVLYSSLQSLLRHFPRYQERFVELFQMALERLSLPEDFLSQFELTRQLGSTILTASGGFLRFFSNFVLVMIFVLFILLERPFFHRKLKRALETHSASQVVRIMDHLNQQIARYLSIKVLMSLATAVVVFGFFALLGVDFPFIWGVLVFLFNFIPNIGSIVISGAGIIFSIIQFFPDWTMVVLASLAILVPQLVIGSILDPRALGNTLNLTPVVILASLLLWNWIWGVAGMFIAVPLTVVIKVVLDEIPQLAFLGRLMERGRSYDSSRESRAGRKRSKFSFSGPDDAEEDPAQSGDEGAAVSGDE